MRRSLCLLALALALALFAAALGGGARAEGLTDLSLEDLLAQEVTSVAKRPQNPREAAAAVFVIGREDIRRSGATSVSELLRMVPGLEVAEITANSAAVTARGFNGAFANKLLVLVDGRAVYLSALSGVLWDQQLVPVEDIERIEVVRGPGATLWGANAVNGVINIITKHAVDSLGGLAVALVDTEEAGRIHLRQGFQIGENGALRLSGVAHRKRRGVEFASLSGEEKSKAGQIGFRYDVEPTDRDAVTLQGDLQRGESDIILPAPAARAIILPLDAKFSGGNLVGRWARSLVGGDRVSLQIYYDRVSRSVPAIDFHRDLIDLDFAHHASWGAHSVVWGMGYRHTRNRIHGTGVIQFRNSDQDWYGGFVQDDIALVPERLTLTLGAKVEHNPKTGFELQPSVRAIWLDPAGWSVWAAASRAARTPSDLETDSEVSFAPAPLMLSGRNTDPEILTAFEIGWRGRLSRSAALDLTAYYNHYDRLIGWSGSMGMVGAAPGFVFVTDNLTEARAYGMEVALDARLAPWWTVEAAASWLDLEVGPTAGPAFAIGDLTGGLSPRSQLSLRSIFDLGEDVDLDVWVRSVGALRDGQGGAYTDLDLRLAWRPTPTTELSLRGVNLLNASRIEMRTDVGSVPIPSARVDRRVQVAIAFRY